MTSSQWPDLIQHLELAAETYGEDFPLVAARAPAAPPVPGSVPLSEPEPESKPGPGPGPKPRPEDRSADLDGLRTEVLPCQKCKLAETRTQVVFGEGSATARVMFIGEAPGFHEDKQGRPFVGPAGQLLDRIIERAMGLRREDVYIANVNKCRPPQNRDPEPDEVAACLPHLKAQVAIIRPEVIVTLGRVAAHNLLATDRPMRFLRGQELAYQEIPVVATWHPAYLLRNAAAKADTWEDIKRVNRLLGNPEIPGG